jgi:segregation and condensation protein B
MSTAPELKPQLEVLLFMARQPLSLEDLAKYLNTEISLVSEALQFLTEHYKDPAYGLQVINVSNGYQFATKPQYAKTLELYINAPQEFSLSTAGLETLVIVAYRQPISRAELEAIRGVNSDGIVKSLMDRSLIEEKGRAETLGRPMLYGTTDVFLKHFGLKDLAELPQDPQLKMKNNSDTAEKLSAFDYAITEQIGFAEPITEEKTAVQE